MKAMSHSQGISSVQKGKETSGRKLMRSLLSTLDLITLKSGTSDHISDMNC